MQVYNEINDKNKNLSIALGFFDGIHIGHRAVLNSAVSYARDNDIKSAVVTFENHPKCFFTDCKPEYILTKQEKLKLFEEIGFDYVYFLAFDSALSKLNADEYLTLLYDNFKPNAISTGFNHFFGNKKSGNNEFLKENQSRFGYKYFEISPVKIDNNIVSSSKIRENLQIGDIDNVNKMLGRRYSLEEIVVEGQKIGRTIGFRTANLLYPKEILNIARGVYACDIEYEKKVYKGVANFGMRPSLANTNIPILEVHIFDFDKEIYGQKIKVFFERKIRDEKKFDSLDELKIQISKDVDSAKL